MEEKRKKIKFKRGLFEKRIKRKFERKSPSLFNSSIMYIGYAIVLVMILVALLKLM